MKIDNKIFNELKRVRQAITTWLLIITVLAYFSFISVIAFKPDLFGQSFLETNFSTGIILGFLLILLIFIVTLIYVYQANKKLEPLIKQIQTSYKK
jgi:uncharacterized membrane protein (DUF485 family)